MTLVKEAQFVSILAHPHLDSCSNIVTNQDKNLVIALSIKGLNSTGFCKDVASEIFAWQIENAEQLHQKVLDLIGITRQKGLDLEFSLSLIIEDKIIFLTYSGGVILKRNNKVKKILESQKEINMVVGDFRENDQIILINKSSIGVEHKISKMLEMGISLERMVSEITLIQQEYGDHNESIAILTYGEKVAKKENKKKFDYKIFVQQMFDFGKTIIYQTKKIFKKISTILQIFFLKIKNQDKKKLIKYVSFFCGTIAVILISWSIKNNQNQKINTNIKNKVTEINIEINKAKELVSEQPLLAREKTQNSLKNLEALKNEKNTKESLKTINDEITKIKSIIEEISGNNSLDKLTVAYNLEDFLTTKIEYKNDSLFLLENNGKEILKISNQNREKIALPENEIIRDFTVSENKLFVLSKGIQMLQLNETNSNFVKIKDEGESDKNGELLSSFGPYLYLLNKNKRNIYRYYYDKEKLSEPIGWLVDKQGISFENINNLMVDGDLWLGIKNGTIMKFSKGSPSSFQIQGINSLPNSPIVICNSETSNSLAILEKQNRRLLIITKDGQLINEIKSNELSGVSSIAFNNDGKRIYAASGSIIYEIEVLK